MFYNVFVSLTRYLQERLKQMEEEKSMAMDTVSKYKVGLWQDRHFFIYIFIYIYFLTAVLCDGNNVGGQVHVSSVWYLGAQESL